MRIWVNEFVKVFGKKTIWLVLIGLMFLNGVLLYMGEATRIHKSDFYAPKHYRNIYEDLEGNSNQEALRKLNKEYKKLKLFIQLSNMGNDIIWDSYIMDENFRDADIEQLVEEYQSGDYLKYTDALWREYWLYGDVIMEIQSCESYSDYLNEIDEAGQILSELSLYTNKSSFSYRNIMKTPGDYLHLKGNELQFGPSNGIKMATEFLATDIIAVLMIMMIIGILITREKELSQMALIKTTFLGRMPLIVSKLFVAYISCVIITLLLYSVNFSIAYYTYGFGMTDRLIQSVSGYLGSNLPITVTEYFIIFIIVKIIIYILFASIIFLMATAAKESVNLYLIIIAIFASSSLAYYVIEASSYLSVFKYMNIISFLNTYLFFQSYLNINFFGRPVNYILAASCFIIIILLVTFFLSVYFFCKQKPTSSSLNIRDILKGFHSKLPSLNRYINTRIFWHECYKIFIGGRSLLLLLAFAGIVIFTYQPLSENLSTRDAYYYKQYMLELEGEVDDNKLTYIADEEARFAEVYRSMELAMEQDNNTSRIVAYQDILAPSKALREVVIHTEYLKGKNGSHYLYDSGYKLLTGDRDAIYKDIQCALLASVMIIVCLANVYTVEYQSGIHVLLKSSYRGRWHTFLCKFGISVIIATIIYVITYGPYFYNVLHAYGVRGLSAPAYSMEHLSSVPRNISILDYLIIISVMRYIGLILAVLIVFCLSVKLKSFIHTLVASAGILILPLLLSMLGISVFNYILLNPLLIGNVF